MLRQYIIPLNTPLPTWAAYGLYAELVKRMPDGFAELLHRDGFTPISQYVSDDKWYLTALNTPTAEAVEQALPKLERTALHRLNQEVIFGTPRVRTISSPESFLDAKPEAALTLRFRTPTAFKCGGYYRMLPTEQLLLQSLMQKWNSCFPEECPIEDEGGGLEAMAQGLVYRSVQLESRPFSIKHAQIPGAVGTVVCDNRCRDFHRTLASALLEFGSYSGVGIKTALGMGGFAIERN